MRPTRFDIDERGIASAPRQVTKAPFEVFAPAFSPDGQWLYARSTRDPTLHRVVRVPSAGGALEDLFEAVEFR